MMAAVACFALASGCEKETASNAKQPSSPEALPASLIVTAEPQGAKEVTEVRKSAADGDEVVVRGVIGGSTEPFVAERAVLQLMDRGVKSCAEMEGDKCPTPWDYCCEPKEQIAANSITVQVLDAKGQPLRAELKGVGGMKPLSEVSVKGKVKKSPDGKAVMVNASEVYVKPAG
jgi:hypothetical protein